MIEGTNVNAEPDHDRPAVPRYVSVNTLSRMHKAIDLLTKDQHKAFAFDQGWNAALRSAMDYAQPLESDAQAYAETLSAARVAQERERWTEAVMAELDGNGQAQAIVMYVTGQPPETGRKQ